MEGNRRPAAAAWVGGVAAVGLVVLALWAWQNAAEVAQRWGATRPYAAKLAVRSAAVAVAAAAQVVLLTGVIGRLYPRQVFDDVLRLCAALVAAVALVGAVALALAAR